MRNLMRRLKPQGIEDVIALLSLCSRALAVGMVERFIRLRHGQEPV